MTNDGLTRFNPNLYKCGKVCVSILNTWSGDKWSACQTINSVLLTLCSLLNDAPLLNEPGVNKLSKDYVPYNNSIEYTNINFAICALLDKSNNKIPDKFKSFYPFMKELFIKNYDKLVAIVDGKEGLIDSYSVQIYQMVTHVNYGLLKGKLVALFDSVNK